MHMCVQVYECNEKIEEKAAMNLRETEMVQGRFRAKIR